MHKKTQRFSLTIAIPAYNEKDSIGEVARSTTGGTKVHF